jgi:NADH-quinone oxidoreductase subunit E
VTLSATTRSRIESQRERYPHPRSAILPCLWAVQNELGWLPPASMAEVAELLGVAPSEVQAVATFYSMYFTRPQGQHHVVVCINAPCALRGADDIVAYLERKLGCPSGGTTADGKFTWQSTIECLGGCGYAPMMQVDHHFHENLTPDKIDAVLERVADYGGHDQPAVTRPMQPRRGGRAGKPPVEGHTDGHDAGAAQ